MLDDIFTNLVSCVLLYKAVCVCQCAGGGVQLCCNVSSTEVLDHLSVEELHSMT